MPNVIVGDDGVPREQKDDGTFVVSDDQFNEDDDKEYKEIINRSSPGKN